ncbi:unnamed protein product, partial [Brachionus calyciflorus]
MFKIILVVLFCLALGKSNGDVSLEEMEERFPDICGLEKNVTVLIAGFKPESQLTIAQTLNSLNQYLRLEVIQTATSVIDSDQLENMRANSPELLKKVKNLFGLNSERNGRLVLTDGDRVLDLCEFHDKLRDLAKTLSGEEKEQMRDLMRKFERKIRTRLPIVISQAISDNRDNLNKLMVMDSEQLDKVGTV